MNTTTKTELTQRAIAQFDAHYDTPIADHLLIPSDSAVQTVALENGKTDFTIGQYSIRLPSETPITVFSDDCDESWTAVVKLNDDYAMPNPITFTLDAESIAEDMDNHFDMYITFCIQLRGDNLFICSQEERSHVWKRYSIAELLNDIVKARFELSDYSESFEGYHNPTNTWNGWNVPSFTKAVAHEVIAYLNTMCEEDAVLTDDDISPNGHTSNGEPLFTVASGFCWVVED